MPLLTSRTATSLLLLSLVLNGSANGAEEPTQPTARERLRARAAEDAKKTAPAKAPSPAAVANSAAPGAAPTSSSTTQPALVETPAKSPETTSQAPSTAKAKAAATAKAKNDAAQSAPSVLPKMEVRKSRITVLDQQLAQQEIEIARERKNLQVSEVDSALNDSKIARPLAIFGGDSTQFRKGVASERVELMEAEKDLIEAIAHAKTKDEKAALQKQLNELKAMRRELDKTMR